MPNPEALMKAKQAGNISLSPGQGTVALVIKNYVKQGDLVTFTLDPQSKQLQNVHGLVSERSQRCRDDFRPVRAVADATNHVTSTLINGVSKELTVNEVNSDYQLRQ